MWMWIGCRCRRRHTPLPDAMRCSSGFLSELQRATKEDEEKNDEPEAKRQRKLPDPGILRSSSGPSGSHRVRSTKESIMFAESTIFIANGAFKIVKRMDQNVPSYYVGCPVHAYHGGGRRHPCVKAMSITQPDEETVLLRLRKWILEGWFVEVLKYDSKKTKHIIEYFVYCYC